MIHNLTSYGFLDKKGFSLTRCEEQRVLTGSDRQFVAFEVDLMKNVLVVKAKIRTKVSRSRGVIMAADGEDREYPEKSLDTILKGSLVESHQIFGHLNYGAVESLAKDRVSGIKLTEHTRENCLTCAQGK